MRTWNYLYFNILMLLFLNCACNHRRSCTIREWKVIDIYRNNYSPFIDTSCNGKTPLINNSEVDHAFFDSVFKHAFNNEIFSMDTAGFYVVKTDRIINVDGVNYETAKVQYLVRGQNVDQEFLLYLVKGKGVYIQQESHYRKLYLLMNLRYDKGKSVNTSAITEKMLKDTFLFPLPPKP